MIRLARAEETLSQKLGRKPQKSEVVQETGFPESRIDLLKIIRQKEYSLDHGPGEGKSSENRTLLEILDACLPTPEDVLSEVETPRLISHLLRKFLTPVERKVITGYFLQELKLEEVGKTIGRTKERARQIRNEAINKLKKKFGRIAAKT